MSKQEQTYNAIISDLYQGTFDDSAWDSGLMGLARLVGGEGPLLISINPSTGELLRYQCYAYDKTVVTEYLDKWAAQDIRVKATLTMPSMEPITEAQSVGARNWAHSTIFNEFANTNDCAWSLGIGLNRNATKTTHLTIQATRQRGPFDSDDSENVRPLISHVRRALEIKDRLKQQGVRVDALRELGNNLSYGIIVLDDEYKIVEASPLALNVLQPICPVAPRTGEALHLSEPTQRELALMLSSSLTRGQLSDGLLKISRGPTQLPLSILVAPTPLIVQSWILSTPRWLLFIFDPERRLMPAIALLQTDLHLSHREAEVASLLIVGLELPQIALRLTISLNTLRTHLKNIFARTGCRSQNELILHIMNSAAWSTTSVLKS